MKQACVSPHSEKREVYASINSGVDYKYCHNISWFITLYKHAISTLIRLFVIINQVLYQSCSKMT